MSSASSVRWEVVATVAEPLPLLGAFAAHHLEIGAARVRLYLDAPDAGVARTLNALPGCVVTLCDDAYWAARGGRPTDHRARQIRNAEDAVAMAESPWIAHLDADEFLQCTRSVGETLAAVPEDRLTAHMSNVERVFAADAIPATIFDGMVRRQFRAGRGLARLGATVLPGFLWYGRAGIYMTRGLIGYVGGKSFYRTRVESHIGIHRPLRPVPGAALADIRVVHFDGMTERHWIEKMYSKSLTSTLGKRNRARTALIRFASGPGVEIERMHRLFIRTMCLSPRRARTMKRRGLVQPLECDIPAAVRRLLPDLDLSPAAFDAALGARTRAVLWRDARFHVNLLDTAAERMLALRGTSPDADMIERLAELAEGRQIAFLDVGAGIGIYPVLLSRKAAAGSTLVAMEWDRDRAGRLERTLATNGIDSVRLRTDRPTDGAALLAVMESAGIVQPDLLRVGPDAGAPELVATFLATAPDARRPRLLLLGAEPDDKTAACLQSAGYARKAGDAAGTLYALAGAPR
jgi:hypothetical protein